MDNFIEFLYSRFLLSDGVSTELSALKEEHLFFDQDGNQAERALATGAAYVVSAKGQSVADDRIIPCEDPIDALIQLADFHRSKIRKPILAITGSRGKSTLAGIIEQLLSEKIVTYRTQGGRHDLVGVAQTLLHVHPQVDLTILEVGARELGEITQSCELARPTHGLITNIGKEHADTFGGIEGVIRGKSELFDYLRKHEGQVFINEKDHILRNMAKRFEKPVLFPSPNLHAVTANPGLVLKYHDVQFKLPFTERFQFENAAAAIAVAEYFGLSHEEICAALAAL